MKFSMATTAFLAALTTTCFPLAAEIVELPDQTPKKIVFLTIPKAGTHLLAKMLELMTERKVDWLAPSVLANPKIDPLKKLNPNDRGIGMHHLFDSFDFIKDDDSGRLIKIMLIRDPRDALISQIGWMANCAWCWYSPRDYNKEFNKLPFDQKLTTTIQFPEDPGYYSMRYFLRKAIEWMQNPEILLLRFEELVGPEGGGDPGSQELAIEKLAAHIGYHLDPEDVARIASKVFGGTQTFKKGQIGEWKKKFTPEQIALFKEMMGEELIQLGYEKDNNW